MLAQATAAQDLEIGSFAPSVGAAQNPRRLVLATYNIRYGVGAWMIATALLRKLGAPIAQPRGDVVTRNLRQAARAFSGQRRFPAPDIIALQEADNATARSGGVHVARELARELSWHYAHAPSFMPRSHPQEQKQWYLDFEEIITLADTGVTGVALLSRFPFANAARIDLPWTDCPWRPRLALGASWRLGDNSLQVINSHIDPHAPLAGQLAQHETILAQAERAAGPVILLGDFNKIGRASCRERV